MTCLIPVGLSGYDINPNCDCPGCRDPHNQVVRDWMRNKPATDGSGSIAGNESPLLPPEPVVNTRPEPIQPHPEILLPPPRVEDSPAQTAGMSEEEVAQENSHRMLEDTEPLLPPALFPETNNGPAPNYRGASGASLK